MSEREAFESCPTCNNGIWVVALDKFICTALDVELGEIETYCKWFSQQEVASQ